MLTPCLDIERSLWEAGKRRIVGVDEAGRGPLAGPVVAAACCIPFGCRPIEGVRDSKCLSPLQRERLFAEIVQQAVSIGVGAASVREIERLNIVGATGLAMRRALARVGPCDHVLIDGRDAPDLDPLARTAVVDGDALSYAIACASIVAKVVRDRLMCRLAKRYPGYGWERNAGYGTKEHLEAIQRLGITPFHRRTYAPVRGILEGLDLPAMAVDNEGWSP